MNTPQPIEVGPSQGVLDVDWDMMASWMSYTFTILTVWANHGDEISVQYSGTEALKGDFVRYSLIVYSFSREEK